jgi:hypothetical protein
MKTKLGAESPRPSPLQEEKDKAKNSARAGKKNFMVEVLFGFSCSRYVRISSFPSIFSYTIPEI